MIDVIDVVDTVAKDGQRMMTVVVLWGRLDIAPKSHLALSAWWAQEQLVREERAERRCGC